MDGEADPAGRGPPPDPLDGIAQHHRDSAGLLGQVGVHLPAASLPGHVDVRAATQVRAPGVLGDHHEPSVEIDVAHRDVVVTSGPAAHDVQDEQRAVDESVQLASARGRAPRG